MRQRFEGSISQITGTNPRTALRKLAEERIITQRHVDAWAKTRNPAVHGLDSAFSAREQVALNDQVHQLFVLLILNLIDYRGPFTDHTTKGYPIMDSPSAFVDSRVSH